ncbi:UNVERIFIED_CONTAM: putative membrane protein YuiD [Sesamum latifolium]|uniref:Membrane protein YuiD n=1 Tax=Sesamum latifolium TaxID=2727402 RepID=A0AAW2TR38_9LAMI
MTSVDAAESLRSSMAPANLPLVSALLACAVAQFLKPFTTWLKDKKWDSRRMLGSGGMPSSHSATVTALATAIGLERGAGHHHLPLQWSWHVLLHAGRQAELLNQIVCELPPEHPVANVRPLRDSLGHTPLQCSRSVISSLVLFRRDLESEPLMCQDTHKFALLYYCPIRSTSWLLRSSPLQVAAGALLGCLVAFLLRTST